MRKNQRCRGSQRSEMSELTPAVPPRTSLSPHKESLPVLFTRPDQYSSATASDLVSDGEMNDSLSLASSDAEKLLGLYHYPTPFHSAQSSASSPGMDADIFRILSSAVDELGLEWSPPEEPSSSRMDECSCRGASRPIVNELHHSSQRSTMRSPNLGVHPTRATYVPLFPPPSLWSTERKKKNMTACLPWIS